MLSSDVPVYNTWSYHCHHIEHKAQAIPQSEEQPAVEQESAITPPVTSISEPSSLTPFAEAIGEEGKASFEDNPSEKLAQKESKTPHEFPGGFAISHQEPEQQFTTAPVSPGSNQSTSSVDVRSTPPPNVRRDKGKGRKIEISPIGEGSTFYRRETDLPPHMYTIEEEWDFLNNALDHWSSIAMKNQTESYQNSQALERLCRNVTDTNSQTADVSKAFDTMRETVNRIRYKSESAGVHFQSPRALATQALYAERGPQEGTVDYERRLGAQARFGPPLTSHHARLEEMASQSSPSTQIKVEERDSTDLLNSPARAQAGGITQQRTASQLRYQSQMRGSEVRAFLKGRRGRTEGPPQQMLAGAGGDPGDEPSDDEGGEGADGHNGSPRQSEGPYVPAPDNDPYDAQGDDMDLRDVGPAHFAGHPAIAPPEPNALGRDYAQRVARQASAGYAHQAYPAVPMAPQMQHPQVPVGPRAPQVQQQAPQVQIPVVPQMAQAPQQAAPAVQPQAQYAAPYQPLALVPGQIQIDPEAEMINNLLQHIRDSLIGAPANLPEIRGLRVKLPDAYEGEDDFDKLDRWLQGLLRYFKLHRLTEGDRDPDRIMLAGSCLRGKAERWYSQEVERPSRIIRDWTFESLLIGLFCMFITTATAHQAIRRYAQVKFSYEEGVAGFHRELMIWAGRLTQYPDEYSFKRRLLNGLPVEYRHHLALYDGISAENSSIDDIVRKARHLEKTLTSLKLGQGNERTGGQGTPMSASNPPTKQQRP